jgi:flagellar hook-associated protein 1 FlgK
MSGLGSFFGLGVLGNALQTFQTAADVTSDNIANVNTPGASRQVVNITQMSPVAGTPFADAHFTGTFGNGSIIASVQRIHEDSYDGLFRGASGSQNYFTTEQNQLQALQANFGEPSNGISSYFTAFQTAVSQLVDQIGTGSGSARTNVLSAAQAFTQALNQASNTIASEKTQVVQQATSVVSTVNGILDQIAALNGQIRASTAVGDNPNTYKDQRDNLIDQLSQYISTQTSIQADGSTLVTVNGQALVNDDVAYHLAAPVTVGVASNGAPTFKIDFATNPPAALNTPGIPLGTGQLAAYQDLYNNKLAVYGQQLDDFASAMANEVNRITQSAYDQNGVAGTALFQPIVASLPISAGNIKVGITNPSQLPAALATTAAGSLVTNMNSANNAVDTSAPINANGALANPPGAGGTTGTLSVTLDGITQSFNYNTNGTDSTIDGFITDFNNHHFGVSASFDASGQRIVFSRDPVNTDLVHRAAEGANPPSADFTIADAPATGAGILSALGASGINGVNQNSTNAFGANDNGAANALMKMFSANVGVPALQTSVAGPVAAGKQTVTLPAGIANVRVGDVLTIDATPGGAAPQENVVVSSISFNPVTGIESFTATFANAHPGPVSITSAQTQTLSQFYGQTVSQMGVDTQTAITGAQSQTTLASNIDKVRQSVDGINIDEETQNLIKFQNAYQATARTINILDSMLGTVVNNLGITSGA